MSLSGGTFTLPTVLQREGKQRLKTEEGRDGGLVQVTPSDVPTGSEDYKGGPSRGGTPSFPVSGRNVTGLPSPTIFVSNVDL